MSRARARKWVRRYLAEALTQTHRLEAALPLTRDQVLLEDPESAAELAAHPRWLLFRDVCVGVTEVWMDSDEDEEMHIGE